MDKIYIVGASEPMITMVLDNLESNNQFPEIIILNNLKRNLDIPYLNEKFKISSESEFLINNVNIPCVLGVNKPQNKKLILNLYNEKRDFFINLIHKSSSVSSTVVLGKGIVINSLVSIAAHTEIDDFVTINRNVSIGHHTKIESNTTINPGSNIAGFVKIGAGTLIGMGVNILEKISIGENCIIGAGSLVVKDIPAGFVAYGNPCKIIRKNE
jgi:sugar O-acyltransferase (sialic acid O-acetyltransferase NeuD family)